MKKNLLPVFILLAELSFGQKNYFSFNADSLYSEKQVRLIYETMAKGTPDNYIIEPTIYHKILKKDSIINYLAFVAQKSNPYIDKNFKFVFKQDSLFLLLNKKLPAFKLMDLNGHAFSSTQLIGKPALINYWAIYCGPCIAEFPQLDELKAKYGHKMNFIAITENICAKDNLRKFLEKNPFNFYILENGEDYKKTLKISAIPRNIFIDKEGYVRYILANFPYEIINPKTGERKYSKNNFFVKIIEELIM